MFEAEFTSHYFLCCHFFNALQATLTHDLRNIDSNFPTLTDGNSTDILLYGNQIYDNKTNQMILIQVIQYIKNSRKIDGSIFNLS